MAILILGAVFVILLVIAVLGLAMRDSYDSLSFTLLGLLGGFSLAVILLGTMLIS
jgi:hypothetical protein